MNCLKPIRAMFMVAPLIIPTLALSEPVTIEYSSRAELVMLAPENVSFECAGSDRPAQLEITEDMSGSISTNFPTTFLDRLAPSQPSVRTWSGTQFVQERVNRRPPGLRNDHWNITIFGNINLCVGLASLKVVGGSLNIFANSGRYEASVISSDNVLQDLDIGYSVNTGMDRISISPIRRYHDQPSVMFVQFVGSDAPIDGRILGRLDIDADQLKVRFTSQSDLDHVTHPTRLNVSLLLVEPSLTSDSPVAVHEGNGEADD